MAAFLLALACAAPAWESAGGPIRVARMSCGATAVEVRLSDRVRVFAGTRGDVVINGGLFDPARRARCAQSRRRRLDLARSERDDTGARPGRGAPTSRDRRVK